MKKESTQSFVDNIKNLSEKTGTDRLILQRLHMMEASSTAFRVPRTRISSSSKAAF